MRVPLCSVSVTAAEQQAVRAAVRRGSVSGTGTSVSALEERIANRLGVEAAIPTNSGTSALEVALAVLGIGEGDDVIVPALTFAAPASAVVNAGANPVICDVDEDKWTIDVSCCRRLLTPRTKAIIAVDLMGNPCDYDGLRELGPVVIEDAAQSIGSRLNDVPCGALADLSILSLHANKVVSAGEGGALMTCDTTLAHDARLIVNHGMTAGYVHPIPGRNLRLSNLAAAFASAQLDRLHELVQRRIEIEARYLKELSGLPFTTQSTQPGAAKGTWLTCIRTRDRDGLVGWLRGAGVDARPIWPSLGHQPFLRAWPASTPVADRLADEGLWLPTFHDLRDDDVCAIASLCREFFER